MAFWQLTRLRVIYPILLILTLFIDGTLMSGLGGILTHFPWHVLPTLTLGWAFLGVQFDVDNDLPLWFYVALVGILFDMYYTGIFGTYTCAFLAAVGVMKQLHRILDERLLSGLFLYLAGLVVYLFITYFAGFIIGLANISLLTFLMYEVLPTVCLNVGLAAVVYYPIWSFFQFLR
ncbi:MULTISPECIES: rod shape-determining protein MreD [Leuconostoc]|uniref:Rod shape-determining protein MreD n=1 Tax=Leuconostoc pseudomesenteroides TaxID=33968 RepID=A0A5B8SXN0_LEUPS|nr:MULTISPECIES: rod shape-determining protein MreD [Leuconostoc]MCC8438916.1 rod shape-determining protein MreD [Leuconostoc pseudomesenteroides]MDG9732772.1 rod shape-determining protein MreD [Leuconostoc pseudomesenteroides]MDN2450320.1 rod shape-determining protein MreD [Leuconostoc sp. UCMA20149]NKZ35573.1 rod shape-determining protein MreD [Leuconostoc pseudomesenteroides]QEA41962.1 rod shape-determining protein MreD [Leuconostoc pseudomesenteroides]